VATQEKKSHCIVLVRAAIPNSYITVLKRKDKMSLLYWYYKWNNSFYSATEFFTLGLSFLEGQQSHWWLTF